MTHFKMTLLTTTKKKKKKKKNISKKLSLQKLISEEETDIYI